jgi:Domain of unknown function (DUF4397)
LRRSAWLWLGLLWGMTLLFTSCSTSSGSGNDAQLRFLLASPDAPQVNVLLDGLSVAGNLGYGNATGYISQKAGSHQVQVVTAVGSLPVFSETISLNASSFQTLLFTGPAASIQPVMLNDTPPTIVINDAYVRVVNASAAMGAADVYIVPAGSGIGGVPPATAGLAFDQDTGYQLTVAGNYEVFMTTPGTSQARLSTGPISLTSAQNQTLVALDGPSGVFIYALLKDQ